MLVTAEVRWFEQGIIPTEIQHWFKQDSLGKQLELPEVREDIYLYTEDNEELGLKLRQGRLEIKWRRAELGIVPFSDRVTGKVETWGKWLCEDLTGESFPPAAVTGKKSWVKVKKERSQRLYQVLPDGLVQLATNQSIQQSCSAELTQLEINGNPWWSIALEASSESDRQLENLQAVAHRIFNTYSGSKLSARASYAYPHWLSVAIL